MYIKTIDKNALFGFTVAPAKINLHLEVLGVRNDGYHSISSILQTISLCDSIAIQLKLYEKGSDPRPDEDPIRVTNSARIAQDSDLCYRAAKAYLERTTSRNRADITVKKRIPIHAGLGGGSSDAAAVLVLLNRMCRGNLSLRELSEVASQIGSDVPFFLQAPAAIVGGRGGRVYPIRPAKRYFVLIVDSGIHVSTADAFRWVDDCAIDQARSDDRVQENRNLARRQTIDLEAAPSTWDFRNDFAPILIDKFPIFRRVYELFRVTGSLFHSVSGSGGCVFGLFESRATIEDAVKKFAGFCVWTGRLQEF